jgi:hypothetical protein
MKFGKNIIKKRRIKMTEAKKANFISILLNKYRKKVMENKCKSCNDKFYCWLDYELGIWKKKELICDDMREFLELERRNRDGL